MKYIPETKRELLELVMKKDVFLGDIHASKITDMSFLFSFYDDATNEKNDRKDFSGIESWDVSNVVNMEGSLLNVFTLMNHLKIGM